jgi:hypothetical protein
MDIETLDKIIKMLDTRIDTLKLIPSVPILHDWHMGHVTGLETFKEHLRKLTVIHTELKREE